MDLDLSPATASIFQNEVNNEILTSPHLFLTLASSNIHPYNPCYYCIQSHYCSQEYTKSTSFNMSGMMANVRAKVKRRLSHKDPNRKYSNEPRIWIQLRKHTWSRLQDRHVLYTFPLLFGGFHYGQLGELARPKLYSTFVCSAFATTPPRQRKHPACQDKMSIRLVLELHHGSRTE